MENCNCEGSVADRLHLAETATLRLPLHWELTRSARIIDAQSVSQKGPDDFARLLHAYRLA
jgi:hypothetical protein